MKVILHFITFIYLTISDNETMVVVYAFSSDELFLFSLQHFSDIFFTLQLMKLRQILASNILPTILRFGLLSLIS